MRLLTVIFLIGVAIITASCATNKQPIVNTAYMDGCRYVRYEGDWLHTHDIQCPNHKK